MLSPTLVVIVTKYKLAVLLCNFCNIFTTYSHQKQNQIA